MLKKVQLNESPDRNNGFTTTRGALNPTISHSPTLINAKKSILSKDYGTI